MICRTCNREYGEENGYCPFCGTKKIGALKLNRFLQKPEYQESIDVNANSIKRELPKSETYGEKKIRFCFKCGKAAVVGDDYCPFCGKAYQQERVQEYDDSSKKCLRKNIKSKGTRKNRKKLALVIALLVVTGLVGLGVILLTPKHNTVNIASLYEKPNVVGIDGDGQIGEAEINDNRVEELLDSIKNKKKREEVREFISTTYFKPKKGSKITGLKNGDKVELVAVYDKNYAESHGLKIEGTSLTIRIKGLKDKPDFDPAEFDAYYSDFIFPESHKRYLEEDDYIGMDEELLQLAINEIYARHGLKFPENKEYEEYFEQFEWYKPRYKLSQFKSSWLNDYEQANVDALAYYRDHKAEMDEAWDSAFYGDEMDEDSSYQQNGGWYYIDDEED